MLNQNYQCLNPHFPWLNPDVSTIFQKFYQAGSVSDGAAEL
jgi:hypothetical protein